MRSINHVEEITGIATEPKRAMVLVKVSGGEELMKAYLEPEEIILMEQAASNLRDKILIRLLFRLGCRISEALALTVEDIDFIQGTVTIIHKDEVDLSGLRTAILKAIGVK